MFKTGDTVLYGAEGVCKISEITEKKFGDTAIEYYVLTPVFSSSSTFFVPIHNQKLTSKMHPVLTTDEIMNIIETTDELKQWPDNDSVRKEVFREIVSGGEIRNVVSVLKSILRHKQEVEASGKKLHKADEAVMKDAQKVLYEEFAMVMDIEKEEVLNIVLQQK